MAPNKEDPLKEPLMSDDDYARAAAAAYEASGFISDQKQVTHAWDKIQDKLPARKLPKKRPAAPWKIALPALIAAGFLGYLVRAVQEPSTFKPGLQVKSPDGHERRGIELDWVSRQLQIRSHEKLFVGLVGKAESGLPVIIRSGLLVEEDAPLLLAPDKTWPNTGRICPIFAETEAGLQNLLSKIEGLAALIRDHECVRAQHVE